MDVKTWQVIYLPSTWKMAIITITKNECGLQGYNIYDKM